VPSASRTAHRAGLFGACVLLLPGAVAGCTTTQDTAAEKQAESKRILEKRDQKQRQRKTDRKKDQEK
jgi:hypothetical protein